MKIAIIGVGNMGSILARHLSQSHSVVLCDHNRERVSSLAKELEAQVVLDPAKAVLGADLVILAVKPKDLESLAGTLLGSIALSQRLISILAGVEIKTLKELFPDASIIRMMPNLAITTGQGILGFSSKESLSEEKVEMDSLFAGLGLSLWIPETKMNAFASLAASSPAFIFVLIEAMIEAGIYSGFSSKDSKEIVLQVLAGSVALLKGSDKTPEELKWQVTSPGGTTIKGIKELEGHSFRIAIWKAIEAASK